MNQQQQYTVVKSHLRKVGGKKKVSKPPNTTINFNTNVFIQNTNDDNTKTNYFCQSKGRKLTRAELNIKPSGFSVNGRELTFEQLYENTYGKKSNC